MKNTSIFETYVYAQVNGKDNYHFLEDFISPIYRENKGIVFVFDSIPMRNGDIECKKMTIFVQQDVKFNIHDFMKDACMPDYEYRLIVDGKTRACGHGERGYRNFEIHKSLDFCYAEKDYQESDEYYIDNWTTSATAKLLEEYVGEHKAIAVYEKGLITLRECITLLNKHQQLYLIDVLDELEIHHSDKLIKSYQIV